VHSKAKVYVLHGEKDQKDRKQAISRLNQGHINVLIATDVAARGLDIEGMDMVINFDMPRKGDDYVHRIGRTGRAGNEGLAISFVGPHEWNLMSSIERYLKQNFEKAFHQGIKRRLQRPQKTESVRQSCWQQKEKNRQKTVG
jgi:ATP-dependent RNA helicase RhlE